MRNKRSRFVAPEPTLSASMLFFNADILISELDG
jgi:hypothetical protein